MGLRRAYSMGAAALLALLAATPALANPDVEAARGETYALLAIPALLFAIIAIEVLVIRLALHPPHVWRAAIVANVLSAIIGLAAVVASSFHHAWVVAYSVGYAVEIAILAAAWRDLRLARVLAAVIGANVVSTAAFFLLLLPGWSALEHFVSRPRVPLTEAAHWGPASLSYRERAPSASFDAVDARHAWLLPEDETLRRSTDGGRHWQQLREAADTMDFVSAGVGWAARRWWTDSAASVGRTADGGQTWQWRTVGDVEITALAAVDSREAWVAILPVKQPGKRMPKLLRTRDGGRSWQPVSIPPVSRIRAIAFVDRDHGWLVADPAQGLSPRPVSLTVLRTSDRGRTFQSVPTPPVVLHEGARVIRALNPSDAWIAAGSDWLLRTHDGGATWEVVTPITLVGASQPRLLDCWFLNPQVGWAVGYLDRGGSALALATRDGGRTWTRFSTGAEKIPNAYFDRVLFLDETHGWLCGGLGDEPLHYPPHHLTQFLLRYRP